MKKIKLTQGQFALVDDEDFEILNQYKWYAAKVKSGDFYAQRMDYSGGNKKIIKMHRFILGLTDEKVHVDHGNGNTLTKVYFMKRLLKDGGRNLVRMERKYISDCLNLSKMLQGLTMMQS